MSLPEVNEIGHYCSLCDHFVPEMFLDIKRPCRFQKRVAKGRFCVDYKPKTVQNERENKP